MEDGKVIISIEEYNRLKEIEKRAELSRIKSLFLKVYLSTLKNYQIKDLIN